MTPVGRAAWILVVALPALGFGVRALLAAREEERRTRPARLERGTAATEPAWTGEGEPSPGVRVVARVAPLHGDAGRQAFEAEILRGRYAGIDGDPWLVVLEVRGEAPIRVDPARVTVVDEAGTALAPVLRFAPAGAVAARPRGSAFGGADPLATLLVPPATVGAGERASFVVFGRAPVGAAQLVVDGHGEVELVRAATAERRGDLPIARIDARPAVASGAESGG